MLTIVQKFQACFHYRVKNINEVIEIYLKKNLTFN